MKRPIFSLVPCLLLLASVSSPLTASLEHTSPNIILIIADDQSQADLGAYGHPTIQTPNLDQMAAQGMRFDQAFLTASSCSPSRCSMITSRYPHNTGAEQLHWPLPKEQTTVSELLRQKGYWTAAAGKWHLGDEVRDRFDLILEMEISKGTTSGADDWLTLLKERPADRPFFLWLAAWDSHRPFMEGPLPVHHQPKDVVLPRYYPATDLYLQDFAAYYDEISRFDENVGRVLQELERQKIADNTVVIVVADNGRPFARDKTTLYDSGVKTPFIVYWPSKIKPGQVCRSIISTIDIAPTFLALAGAVPPPSFQGKSLVPLLEQPDTPFREFAFSERNWHDFEDHGRSVRSARYRYIRNDYNDLPATPSADTVYHKTWWELVRLFEQGALNEAQSRPFLAPRPPEELYDLENDPQELVNLATRSGYEELLQRHRNALERWITETDDFIPSVRTPDDFDRRTGAPTPNRQRPRPSKKETYGTSGKY